MPGISAIRVETREDLVSLLYEAAELEHGLACSYLFAAFSIKARDAEGVTAEQADALERWRSVVKDVALEEMLHLALVSNLLTALGAAPHLRRPPFPQTSPYYPEGVTIELLAFNETSLTRFIDLERPEGIDAELVDAEPSGAAAVANHDEDPADTPVAAPGALVSPDELADTAAPVELSTVGDLYHAIDEAFCALVAAKGEDLVFIGPPAAQATADYFELHELAPVTGLASARQALQILVQQGEGVRGDWSQAHYGKFREVRDELRALRQTDPGFAPAWPVLRNPLVNEPANGTGGQVVTDVVTTAVMALTNGSYGLMTAMLLRFFAHTDESDAQLRILAAACAALMSQVINPLGVLLATLPAGPGHGIATGGASFEFHRSVTLAPHRRAAWMVFHERLLELATFARQLMNDTKSSVLSDVGGSLETIGSRIAAGMNAEMVVSGET